jgi:ABC-type antimicrobial peptide transport system permease subunit
VFEGGCTASTCSPLYIIGVVSDVKYNGMTESGDAAYSPSTQGMGRSGYLMIRTAGDPSAVVAGVRSAIRKVDPGAPVDPIGLMTDRMYASTAPPRHWTMLLAGFALAALALAAIGIFGLLSYLVTTMRREIGVRVALGAQRRQIVRMVLGRGLTSTILGAFAGLVIATAGRQLLAASLYGVRPGDPTTLVVVTVGLVGVALAASWIPARQASRIDPMVAIRAD